MIAGLSLLALQDLRFPRRRGRLGPDAALALVWRLHSKQRKAAVAGLAHFPPLAPRCCGRPRAEGRSSKQPDWRRLASGVSMARRA